MLMGFVPGPQEGLTCDRSGEPSSAVAGGKQEGSRRVHPVALMELLSDFLLFPQWNVRRGCQLTMGGRKGVCRRHLEV